MYWIILAFKLVKRSPRLLNSLLLLVSVWDSSVMFYTIYGNPVVYNRRDNISITHKAPLRIEVEAFLYKFFHYDECTHFVIPTIIEYTFYPDNHRVWLEFPHAGVFLVIGDVVDRNPYLLPQVITCKNYLDSLNVNFAYRNPTPVIHEVGVIMDVLENRLHQHSLIQMQPVE